ncbi:MAG: hypothetical protein KY468_17670, partial [Armatimonadetes bacterium]|nr:hypothetical protein [Armatimonadota bacterium]
MRLTAILSLGALLLVPMYASAAPARAGKTAPHRAAAKKASATRPARAPRKAATVKPRPQAGKKAAPASTAALRLEVTPAQIVLDGPTARHTGLAALVRPDGSRKDVTSAVKLHSSAPKIAAIDGRRIVARGDGKAVLSVKYGEARMQVPVEVKGANRPVAVSFRNDVVPVMARIGCSSGGCHGANSGKGGLKLSLRGYAPELDHV